MAVPNYENNQLKMYLNDNMDKLNNPESNNYDIQNIKDTPDADKILEITNVKINNLHEIKDFINSTIETIILNFNIIVICDLFELPNNIVNILIENNLTEIEEIKFNTNHAWNKIILKNSNIKNISDINNLICNELDLSDNDITNITFNYCKITNLILVENNIQNIYFNNCEIENIDLSSNRINDINNLEFPDNLIELNLSNNIISRVYKLPETIKKLNLKKNLIEEITYLPKNILMLELNDNRLQNFNKKLLSKYIAYLDVTNNFIKNNYETFGDIEAESLYYDTDSDDSDNDNTSDDDSEISIKLSNFYGNTHGIEESKLNSHRTYSKLIPIEMKWKILL